MEMENKNYVIALEGMSFLTNHGYYEEEKLIHTKFTVDAWITVQSSNQLGKDTLENTVDYQELYWICQQCFSKRSNLIETLAYSIATRMKSQYAQIQKVKVRVSKWNPPLNGPVQRTFVEIEC